MKYDDIRKKWRTKERERSYWKIAGTDNSIPIETPRYKAEIGDLVKSYVDHINMPWWKKRDLDWKLTEKKLRAILNQITLTWLDF